MGDRYFLKWIMLLAFLRCSAFGFSQPTYFVKEFGDSSFSNHGNSALQISSGSIFVAGYGTTISGSSNRDFTLTKLDAYGNIQWTNHFGTIQDETSERMIFNGNKSLIICGQLYDTSMYTTSAMLLSVDTSGTLEWMQFYSAPNVSQSFSGLCLANDGGLIASGFQSDSTSTGNNFLLMKTDAQGNTQWKRTFGDSNNNEVSDAVLQIPNGDILISGDRQVDVSKYNAWLVKTDSAGNQLWDLISANRNNGGCKNIIVDTDNNIVVIGEAATDSSAQFDIQLSKIDQNGNLIWLKYVTATDESDAGFAIQQDSAGYYMITGYYYDTLSASKKILLMLLDTAGNELNRKVYGNGLQNIGYDLQHSFYGGYLIAGTDFSNSQCVLVFDNLSPLSSVSEVVSDSFFVIVSPNPFTDNIIAYGTNENGQVQILDVTGKELLRKKSSASETNITIENLTSGFYFLRYSERNKSVNLKLLKY